MSRLWLRRRPVPGAWALIALGLLFAQRWLTAEPELPPLDNTETYHVVRIEEGNALVLDGGQHVHLIGVRSRPTAETRAWLTNAIVGRPVRLEFDRHRLDDSGAWLAYVFTGDRFINAEFLRAGLGRFDPTLSLRSDRERVLRQAVP